MVDSKQGDKLEFRQIILLHIRKILEISSHELRDGSYTSVHANTSETIFKEDTRISYFQSIENLAYILIPYFDTSAKKVYDDSIKILNGLNFEVKKILKTKFEEMIKENPEDKVKVEDSFVIEMKLIKAKELFCELNLLLHRNDYLKSSIYGENKDEVAKEK